VTGTGRYLYAVTRGLDAGELDDVHGLEGAPLEVVERHGLSAVVSTVPLASYGEAALRRNLEDLDWLSTVAREHDAVVRAVAARAPIAPVRLATICFDDDAVRARLDEWGADLTAALDRVDGCSEWSVKVLAPPLDAQPAPAESGAPASGAEYLRRRRAELDHRATRTGLAAETAQLIHDDLASRSRAARMLPAQDPRLSGHTGTLGLNGA